MLVLLILILGTAKKVACLVYFEFFGVRAESFSSPSLANTDRLVRLGGNDYICIVDATIILVARSAAAFYLLPVPSPVPLPVPLPFYMPSVTLFPFTCTFCFFVVLLPLPPLS